MLSLTLLNTLAAQETILNSYGFGSDKDSILLEDYIEGAITHLIIIPAKDCDDCLSYYPEYAQKVDSWFRDSNLQVTVLKEKSSGLASVGSQISVYEAQYGLDVLLSDKEFTESQTLLLNGKLNQSQFFNRFLSVAEVESEIQKLLTQEEVPKLFDHHILQCLEDLEFCDDSNQLIYTCGDVEINGLIYTEVSAYDTRYFIRETSNGDLIYLYNQELQQDEILLDYRAIQCDTIQLYSVLTHTYQSFIVSEHTCVNGIESWTLNLLFGCDQQEIQLTLLKGQGSNAGLIPLFDPQSVYTVLNCQYEDSILTVGSEEVCPMDKPSEWSKLRIYPNPTNGSFTIDSGWKKVDVIGLFSLDGKRIVSGLDESNQIDISYLAAGMYLIGIEQDSRTTYHKIVKY